MSRSVYLLVNAYFSLFLQRVCQRCSVEGGDKTECVELDEVHIGQGLADLSDREHSLMLFLHDFEDQQRKEANEEVGGDALGVAYIDRAHVEI